VERAARQSSIVVPVRPRTYGSTRESFFGFFRNDSLDASQSLCAFTQAGAGSHFPLTAQGRPIKIPGSAQFGGNVGFPPKRQNISVAWLMRGCVRCNMNSVPLLTKSSQFCSHPHPATHYLQSGGTTGHQYGFRALQQIRKSTNRSYNLPAPSFCFSHFRAS